MAERTVNVAPSGGDYTTLAAALTGEYNEGHNDLTVDNGSGGAGILNFKISGNWSGSPDTAYASCSTFTTNATNYVVIYTDAANYASAKWDTTKYILQYGGGDQHCLNLYQTNYVRVKGLQLYHTGSSSVDGFACIGMNGITQTNNLIYISDCFLRGTSQATYYTYGIRVLDGDANLKVWNTIAWGHKGNASAAGIRLYATNGLGYVYNCLICDCYRGIQNLAGNNEIKNCASFNNTDDFLTTAGTPVIDYCASDDADGTNAEDFTADATDWDKVWTDYANGDFTLKNYTSSPCCVNQGTDDPGSGLYSTDISGNTRVSPWDIGPVEYTSSGAAMGSLAMAHMMRMRRNG